MTGEAEDVLWWKEGLNFSCLGCGRCCRGEPGAIWLLPHVELRIAAYLDLDPLSFRRRYVTMRWGRPSIAEGRNGQCLFYDFRTARCGIYPVRPLQCSTWPFWPKVLKSPETWRIQTRRCPGMDQGEFHPASEIAIVLKAHMDEYRLREILRDGQA